MRQAQAEGVATEESAILAIEKDKRAFGDDHDEDDAGNGEVQVKCILHTVIPYVHLRVLGVESDVG